MQEAGEEGGETLGGGASSCSSQQWESRGRCRATSCNTWQEQSREREECWEKTLSPTLTLSLPLSNSHVHGAEPGQRRRSWLLPLPLRPLPLTHLQDGAVVEVVGAGPALQRGEGHVAAGERRDVAEIVGAKCLLLVLAGADEAAVQLLVRLLARAAVVLVRHPRRPLAAALVDGEALRAAGVELQPHVGDVERLACGQRIEGRMEGSKVNVETKHQAERSDSSESL